MADIFKPFQIKGSEDGRVFIIEKESDFKIYELLTVTTKKNAKKIHIGFAEESHTGYVFEFYMFNRSFKVYVEGEEIIQVDGF